MPRQVITTSVKCPGNQDVRNTGNAIENEFRGKHPITINERHS